MRCMCAVYTIHAIMATYLRMAKPVQLSVLNLMQVEMNTPRMAVIEVNIPSFIFTDARTHACYAPYNHTPILNFYG